MLILILNFILSKNYIYLWCCKWQEILHIIVYIFIWFDWLLYCRLCLMSGVDTFDIIVCKACVCANSWHISLYVYYRFLIVFVTFYECVFLSVWQNKNCILSDWKLVQMSLVCIIIHTDFDQCCFLIYIIYLVNGP